MNPKAERLATLVKELRSSQSQYKFAKLLGVSRPSVTFWELGQAWPDTQNLQKLADLKGWNLSDLQAYLMEGELPSGEPVYRLESILGAIRNLPSEAVAEVASVAVKTLAKRSASA